MKINLLELYIYNYSYHDLIEIEKYLNKNIMDLITDEKIFTNPTTYDFKKIKENAINFYEQYFKLHDIYYTESLPKCRILKPYINYKLNKIYTNNQKINPFDLPVYFEEDFNDSCVKHYKYNQNIDIFKNIVLPKLDNTSLMSEIYIHEISHTQIPPQDIHTLSNLNDELFSIFNELLYSTNHNNGKMILLRLNNLLKLINKFKELQCSNLYGYLNKLITYIESTLKAIMLLYLYDTETNTSTKARIIDDIQSIMDCQLSINEFLSKYDINERDYKSTKFIKHYVK